MKAGIPLKKIDYLRHLLEATNTPLTDSSHLATYTPFILEEEDKRLQTELASTSALSIVFDGSVVSLPIHTTLHAYHLTCQLRKCRTYLYTSIHSARH